MAPNNIGAAHLQYNKAINKVINTCKRLEYYLPPTTDSEGCEFPPNRPRQRTDSVAACDRCAAELQVLPVGDREGHVCNHRVEERRDGEGDRGSDAGSESSRRVPVKTKGRPRVGLLRDYISNVDTAIDGFSDAVAILVSLLDDEGDKERYEDRNQLLPLLMI